MGKIAAISVPAPIRLVIAPVAASAGTAPAKAADDKALAVAAVPAAPQLARPAVSPDMMSVLIQAQAGQDANEQGRKGEPVAAGHDGDHRDKDHGQGALAPPPAPVIVPPSSPPPKPVVVAGADLGAVQVAMAKVASRLMEETVMTATLATSAAAFSEEQAAHSIAEADVGITLMRAMQASYAAWQADFGHRAHARLAA